MFNHFLLLLPFVCLFQTVMADFSYVGCYANTGVSLAFKNTYSSSPVQQCSSFCGSSKYLGVIDGTRCYCGDSQPLSNAVSDANCNSNCTDSSSCGGNNYYAVYANSKLLFSSSSSSSSTLSTSTISSSSSSSSDDSSSSSGYLSSTMTISPSSSSGYVSVTTFNSSSLIIQSTAVNVSTTSRSSVSSHSHRSKTTSLSSDQTVITSNSEYVEDGVTVTSAVLLTTQRGGDVELTRTADNVVSSSVTVVGASKSANIRSQVAGGVVGAASGISLICFLVWYYTRRVKQKDEEEKQRNLATIAATMVSKNTDLSHSGTVYGVNPFSPRNNTLGSHFSNKRKLDVDGGYPGQIIRMGSTGRESTFVPMRMGSTGHDEETDNFGNSTLGSLTSASSDGYYAQKMMMHQGSLTRNSSSATNQSRNSARYSFASFESGSILVDDEIASGVERDDGSIHEYSLNGPSQFGLTIANPDNDSDSDDDNEQDQSTSNNNSKLRVLF